jgi:FlaA1/EpsC-like NDP-sugar epimerase
VTRSRLYLGLEGKVALVTGSTSGIGHSIVDNCLPLSDSYSLPLRSLIIVFQHSEGICFSPQKYIYRIVKYNGKKILNVV